MFIHSALFIRGRMFLCADKQSSVCFADVRGIAAGASEFISCTTFDFLSGGVLSLVFVKKHNFVVFCFIRMFTFGSTRHLRSLRLSLLTSCVVRSPTNGMVSQIVESWLSREVSLVL